MADTLVSRSNDGKKRLKKVPKKIHKAEREKLKRDQLNDLFLDLANAIELVEQDNGNNGKACILNEAIRLLNNMSTQLDSLKKDNTKLMSESHYMTMEKNELKDETCTLEAEIEKLQTEVEAKKARSTPNLNISTSEYHQVEMPLNIVPGDNLNFYSPHHVPIIGSVYVIPDCHDLQPHKESENYQLNTRPASIVSKPCPRYPNVADSWPSQLLDTLSKGRDESQITGS